MVAKTKEVGMYQELVRQQTLRLALAITDGRSEKDHRFCHW